MSDDDLADDDLADDDLADEDEDEDEATAVAALLTEVKDYLDDSATDKRGQKLLGKVEQALETWFEDDDEDDEDDEDGEDDGEAAEEAGADEAPAAG